MINATDELTCPGCGIEFHDGTNPVGQVKLDKNCLTFDPFTPTTRPAISNKIHDFGAGRHDYRRVAHQPHGLGSLVFGNRQRGRVTGICPFHTPRSAVLQVEFIHGPAS
jgi:hypothetical protein